jgi:hypothetical protein
MNNHHPLCYNDEWIDPECDLCIVIKYVIDGLTPMCGCGVGMVKAHYSHQIGCKYGAFMYSQDRAVQWW